MMSMDFMVYYSRTPHSTHLTSTDNIKEHILPIVKPPNHDKSGAFIDGLEIVMMFYNNKKQTHFLHRTKRKAKLERQKTQINNEECAKCTKKYKTELLDYSNVEM